jgi:hypothetical protein
MGGWVGGLVDESSSAQLLSFYVMPHADDAIPMAKGSTAAGVGGDKNVTIVRSYLALLISM